MRNEVLGRALQTILSELVNGPPQDACFVLNPGDPGLLNSLDRLSAADASRLSPEGGASIAAHVDHVCYGFEVLNRWLGGQEDAFEKADYTQSWKRTAVSDAGWTQLRARLAAEVRQWTEILAHVDAAQQLHVTGAIAIITHLAYHLGAIRQINRSIRGPAAAAAQPE
jgi:hypothetical protein